MRGYPEAMGRPVAVPPSRRWPDRISRISPRRYARIASHIEAIELRARQAQVQQRAWAAVPDPRWHRGRR
jgi:hypothetical protein